MHQEKSYREKAQLENSKLGNFAARKRCYQFRWQEICIRHLLKVYTGDPSHPWAGEDLSLKIDEHDKTIWNCILEL